MDLFEAKNSHLVDESTHDLFDAIKDIRSFVPDKPVCSRSPFLRKLWTMLSNPEYSHCISWDLPEKKSFTIHSKEMIEDILPKFFKSSRFLSFQRQLNYFNFTPSSSTHMTYRHELFRADSPENITKIKRKLNTGNLNKPGPKKRRMSYSPSDVHNEKMMRLAPTVHMPTHSRTGRKISRSHKLLADSDEMDNRVTTPSNSSSAMVYTAKKHEIGTEQGSCKNIAAVRMPETITPSGKPAKLARTVAAATGRFCFRTRKFMPTVKKNEDLGVAKVLPVVLALMKKGQTSEELSIAIGESAATVRAWLSGRAGYALMLRVTPKLQELVDEAERVEEAKSEAKKAVKSC
jgi:hypothetical protein